MSNISNKGLVSSFNNLPPVAKTAIIVGGVIGIALLARAGIRYINAANERREADQASKEGDELEKIGYTLTYPKSQYAGWANVLEGATDGCGTNVTAILSVMGNMKNDLDVTELIKAYGTRTNSCLFSSAELALRSTLHAEDSKTPELVNNMFKKKGIKYRF